MGFSTREADEKRADISCIDEKTYLRLLIEEACAASKTKTASMGWQSSFADDMENLKERMENLIN